jgi:hypothetical protein
MKNWKYQQLENSITFNFWKVHPGNMATNGVQHGCQACAFWLKIQIQNGVFLYNLNGNNVKLVFLITYGWEIQNVHI